MIKHLFHNSIAQKLWWMTFSELDYLFSNQCKVAHISQAHVHLCLRPIGSFLFIYYSIGNLTSQKQVNGEMSIESTLHRPIEYLLDDVVDNVVQEVVPRKPEKEVLFVHISTSRADACPQ